MLLLELNLKSKIVLKLLTEARFEGGEGCLQSLKKQLMEHFKFFKFFILDFYDKNSVTCTSEYKDPSRESDFLGKLYYRDSATRFKKNHIWGF